MTYYTHSSLVARFEDHLDFDDIECEYIRAHIKGKTLDEAEDWFVCFADDTDGDFYKDYTPETELYCGEVVLYGWSYVIEDGRLF